MPNEKRLRGRPRGSGKDDSRHLAKVAEVLVKEPSLKPTAAMTRVMRSCGDWKAASEKALIRRWQQKWSNNKESFLLAARKRPEPSVSLEQLGTSLAAIKAGVEESMRQPAFQKMAENVAEVQRRIEETFKLPGLQHMIESAAVIQRNVEQIASQPGFQRMLENCAEVQRRIEQALNQPGFQRMLEQTAAVQQQFEKTMRQMRLSI
jgi:hypothetical protein